MSKRRKGPPKNGRATHVDEFDDQITPDYREIGRGYVRCMVHRGAGLVEIYRDGSAPLILNGRTEVEAVIEMLTAALRDMRE